MAPFHTRLFLALTLAASSCATAIYFQPRDTSLPAVTVKGNAFFAGDSRFYIRGVDYQPGGSSLLADPIADVQGCLRDIPYFQQLGINTVRVYSVDNTASHDTCMNALADAGIYLVLDLNTPTYSLNRGNVAPSYNDVYLQSLFATVDAFEGYTNTLAFFSGNEVVNDGPSSTAAPYVKAVTRDVRQYIRSRKYRGIPVGYSAADVSLNRLEMAEYMNCGTEDERSDFFAFNDYSWCDPSSFVQSGWDQKVKNFTGYGLPLFLSEYGCNTNTRDFGEVEALYNPEMTAVYSGGLVYEYSQGSNDYGLVNIEGNGVTVNTDFDSLMSAFKTTPNPTGGTYNETGGASGCPAYSSNWLVHGDTLPAIPSNALKYMTAGAGTGPGLKGPGSQNAGTPSTGTATPGSGQPTVTGGSASSEAGRMAIPEFSFAPLVCMSGFAILAVFGVALV